MFLHSRHNLAVRCGHTAVCPVCADAVIKLSVCLVIRGIGVPAPGHNLPYDHLRGNHLFILGTGKAPHAALRTVQKRKVHGVPLAPAQGVPCFGRICLQCVPGVQRHARLDTEGRLPVRIDTGSCLPRLSAYPPVVGDGLLVTDGVACPVMAVRKGNLRCLRRRRHVHGRKHGNNGCRRHHQGKPSFQSFF